MSAEIVRFPGSYKEPGKYSVVKCTHDGRYERIRMGEGWQTFRTAFGFYRLMKRRCPDLTFTIIPGPGNKRYRIPSGDPNAQR